MRGEQEAALTAAADGSQQGWWWLPERGIARTLLEALIIVPAYALYQLVRGTVDGRTPEAFQRAAKLVDIEQAMGIFWEAEAQGAILTWDIAVRLANTVYVWGHLPLIILVAIWLLSFHRHRYALFRNAFLISGGIGLLLFWLIPTAPPRFLQYWGFVDTTVSSTSYYFFQPPAFVNQYAAMPSLHFGWSLLAAVALFLHLRSPFRYLALVLPVVTLAGVVLTGNHFFLDAVAGAAVAMLGLSLAMLLRAYLPRSKPFSVLA
ncbi:MAG: phosphatase PAP2 family protein [Dehalococcoidia bacterium]|nr:phosphatase PAP2 family protein [Dehalococcoidia bacterium]